MVPTRKDKGKVDEGSTASDPLNLRKLVDTPREKRLLLNFRNHTLTLPKYGNMSSFPFLSFDFPALFHYQELDTLISHSGSIYIDLVRAFHANLSIENGCVLTSNVKGK